ncbi:MAG: bifunctional diguanylate cyclase/phosphodiesterase [Rhizobiales bacterium]|nr:bifunctional diguanylate cyclase/phosphodiesterase [Hyphomicrobiales bacterium]
MAAAVALDNPKRRTMAARAARMPWLLPIILLVCAIGLAAIAKLQRDIDTINARSSRFEIVAATPRALFEADETRLAAHAYFEKPGEEAAARLKQAFEILYGRMNDLRAGAHRELHAASEVARSTHERAMDTVETLDSEIQSLGLFSRHERFDALFVDLVHNLQSFAAEGLRFHAARSRADYERVQKLGWWQVVLTAALLVSISSSLLLALAQTRRLRAAHAAAHGLSQKYAYLANHDPMTGLANRRHGLDLVERLIARAEAEDAEIGVVCLDVDRFKQVNDTLGHAAGDALIVAFAERLRAMSESWTDAALMRLGGDEFVLSMIVRADGPQLIDYAREVSERLADAYEIEGHVVSIGASVGATSRKAAGCRWMRMLAQADIALRHAKERGRGQIALYEKGMFETERRRHRMEQDLRFAMERGEIELHYQPIVALGGGLKRVEALLRWRHPDYGMISPTDFLPVAEDAGLILEMGEWALRAACRDAMRLPAHIGLSVNLSAAQLIRVDMAERVRDALAQSGLPARRLEVEITEIAMMRNEARVARFIAEATASGVSVALDDFGAGYSSIGYLRRFPCSRLKIDPSFIQDVERDPEARAVVRAVVSLAHALDMSVTAEGVETQGQALLLAAEGCEDAQGFFFARPMPLSALIDWATRAEGQGLKQAG